MVLPRILLVDIDRRAVNVECFWFIMIIIVVVLLAVLACCWEGGGREEGGLTGDGRAPARPASVFQYRTGSLGRPSPARPPSQPLNL